MYITQLKKWKGKNRIEKSAPDVLCIVLYPQHQNIVSIMQLQTYTCFHVNNYIKKSVTPRRAPLKSSHFLFQQNNVWCKCKKPRTFFSLATKSCTNYFAKCMNNVQNLLLSWEHK